MARQPSKKRRPNSKRPLISSNKDHPLDKRPVRAPRRPEAARYERGRRTGAKKRLGR